MLAWRSLLPFKKVIALAAIVLLVGFAGIAVTLKFAVDHLLDWDATESAEGWAKYLAENVTDIEEIAAGGQPSAESMNFFVRTQLIRDVFGFEIFDLNGIAKLRSNGSRISSVPGAVHDEIAARAAQSDRPVVAVKEGAPPLRPRHYSEAYLPVIIDGRPRAVVAAYVDLTEHYEQFRRTFLVTAVALFLLSGVAIGIPTIAWHQRTKEKRRADQRIHFLAHHDSLTGLANRSQLVETLDVALAGLAARGETLALHFIDIDRFKAINDTFGHDGGDMLLKTFAERIFVVTRRGDIVARFGGDEFIMLQSGIKARDEAESFALRVNAALSKPIQFKEHEINATVSIGYALAPDDANSSERLLKCADLALYQAKADGRNCVRGFLPDMDVTFRERIRLERTIRYALDHHGFVLHFQPIFEIPNRRLIGFEALLRLRTADGTLLPPAVFISVAEEIRVMDKIGAWVIREACRTAATWPKHLTVSVNVSVAQFEAGGVSQLVADALKETGLEPGRLEIEITESLLLGDKDSTMVELRTLKAMGVAIVMDDFGTGYSSLSYLWQFPFNKIKIDQSFMKGLDRSGQNAETIVKTIIALGRELRMRVTVEGVETAKHAAFLDEIKGDQAQGFFFGPPIPISEIPAVILSDFQKAQPKPADDDTRLRRVK